MFSDVFLAMTAGELKEYLPNRAAYMACHFSPYGKGLSNLPLTLPEDSLLLVDDSMPPGGHDPAVVAAQIADLVSRFSVKAVLLDFQNPPTKQLDTMAVQLVQALPCPVAVTEPYANAIGCPVFLSPIPANMALQTYLSPWLKQGIYLEIAPQAQIITVTEHASTCSLIPFDTASGLPLEDRRLFCHYNVTVSPAQAQFTLCRTGSDIAALADRAYAMGVLGVVGLYQELSKL